MTTTYPMPEVHTPGDVNPLRARVLHWAALLVVLSGTFMVTLDISIVNVAIPSLQQSLHANSGAIQLVVAGYGLALATGLITAGRLGDLYGRRRMFALGLGALHAHVGGLWAGLVPRKSPVAARILQGPAAALLSPQVLAIVGIVYTGEDRARAFTVYGLALGIAAVSGQLIGGLLIQANVVGLGWRSCFLINIPVGVIALSLVPRVLSESRWDGARQLDLVRGVFGHAGDGRHRILALSVGRELGSPAWKWAGAWRHPRHCFWASSPTSAAVFSRAGDSPLLDLSLFGEQAFTAGLLTTLVFFAGMASFFLILSLYLQEGHGLRPASRRANLLPLSEG